MITLAVLSGTLESQHCGARIICWAICAAVEQFRWEPRVRRSRGREGGQEYDPFKADIYSCGIVLRVMLPGRLPADSMGSDSLDTASTGSSFMAAVANQQW